MKKILSIIGAAAFAVALGIVGAVEHGAPIARMLWIVPLLVVMAYCVKRSEHV